jgi:hypothetical protein
MPHNNRSAVNERRRKLWTLLTKGMKGYEIARELKHAFSRELYNILAVVKKSKQAP